MDILHLSNTGVIENAVRVNENLRLFERFYPFVSDTVQTEVDHISMSDDGSCEWGIVAVQPHTYKRRAVFK
ncbi:hypothetical protein M1M34_gp100 [Haloarcula tailed virus 2]|uniref:Uncharacterized protein n=1 Tax=Haloarcula tailed virus 2 TaxID=2877989 RepID=A0AAE8Y1N5_9CAUD|nr:hypothetical protein M1M34_gp100 [Haloarcula tailed virus 2]UBF23233.1 hypothetical protein HATV-2_gp82 [Haloarcula tailed virus 2]